MKKILTIAGFVLVGALVIALGFTAKVKQTNSTKTKIYNLIILDKSGSMNRIRAAAYQGCNEVLNGIRTAQNDYADNQEHYVSLMLFDSNSMPYIHKGVPASQATDLNEDDYVPVGLTPLLDAMGSALTELKKEVEKQEIAVGVVTVISDGLENDSHNWSREAVAKLVEELKEKGWTFAFMGTNQDVLAVSKQLNIDNSIHFEYNDEGLREAWSREQKARSAYYDRVSKDKYDNLTPEQRARALREKGDKYYDK